MTQLTDHPYNTCFRPHHSKFPIFLPVGISESDVVNPIFEDVDPNEPAPTTVSSVAPVSEHLRDTQIFTSSVAPRSTSRLNDSAYNVADIIFL